MILWYTSTGMKTFSTGNLPDGQKTQLRLHQETVWIWIRVKRGTDSGAFIWSTDGADCVRIGMAWCLLLQIQVSRYVMYPTICHVLSQVSGSVLGGGSCVSA